ncbi:disease resistance protein RML1A-like isoform X2 [Cynara cardunculus var. scolymus]|uniref:disease resistance protein RML1A-like isoform X2 n=1 Tax=Cynara cardunculus var. scolymus TaxID=59895 RepID=UPI000D6266CE|nr:disease resistance protein RML1A-like isoform X2 [Cynara cardunculus var. scolymus]
MVVLSEICSSSSAHAYRYDVFLSFRGLDTRHNFTDHLYEALCNVNITTFLDDEEMETGEDLKPELKSAIKASRASIIVLSQNYASSTWCLDELVLILDQKRTSGHIVIPIFYHVEPTDVRKQQNSFGIAMRKHKHRMEIETNAKKRSHWAKKVELWNEALMEIADLKGKNSKNRKETEFIQEIVTEIHRRLGVPLKVTLPFLIGMDHHIKFITYWLKDGSSTCAEILTIVGMGGIGKTSLAKYLFCLHCREFQRSSFVEDISRRCAEKLTGLLDLQKQICGDISNKSSIQVHDVSIYTSQIENTLAHKKVFLVLDDVDSFSQLDALLGNKGFHPGCKIIITTKDASLTEKCELFNLKVQPKHTKHLLEALHETQSLELLCLHAFKCSSPKEGYIKVSKELVKYCKGHPLALSVLGRSLRNGNIAEWEDCLERLKDEPDFRIKKVLQMSFDSLPSTDDKELFKHIACFFAGKDRESTETILKACKIRTVLGIKNLVDRCLLSIDSNNKLMMHQLVQEMGRDIVRQESPDMPEERSRLWCHEESFNVLEQNRGTRKLKGLVLDMEMLEKGNMYDSVELRTDALSKMDNLMLLQLNYVRLGGSYENFPKKLRWLCMHGFPLEYIPPKLQLENLVALDMSYSSFKFLDMSYGNSERPGKSQKLTGSCSKDNKRLLRSLKILNLSFCKQLHSLCGFIELPALEKLLLSNCIGLIEVCESIWQCDHLELIDLSYCNEVGKILRTIGMLKKVKILKLDGCNLSENLIKMRDTELPEMVMANNLAIHSQTSFSTIVEIIPRDLGSSLIFLSRSLECLSLKNNGLSNESFPMDFSNLSMLKELYLDGNNIVSLPNCVRGLPRLEKLSIDRCNRLTTLEHPPLTLKHLIMGVSLLISKVVFDREMSPIMLSTWTGCRSLIEGMFKVEDMADVEEEVLRSLGWTNLDFIKNQLTESKVEMQYEFGIFSTRYEGKEMPNWISDRREGSSISLTIPSSPHNLKGLNFCIVFMAIKGYLNVLGEIRISNITKNRTWIYNCFGVFESTREGIIVYLSHWMFGKSEMEDGDEVTATVTVMQADEHIGKSLDVLECGISLVYDDGKKKMEEEEEDVLGYYKSWNHIIGGDLSPFQTTTPGVYDLNSGPINTIPTLGDFPQAEATSLSC